MRVVVIEDEIITALFLEQTIEKHGHQVVAMFDNGTELCTFLETNQVDLVFMDININGKLDGIQVAKNLYVNHQHISVVFITAYKDSDTIKASCEVQPVGYLIKPVLAEDVEAILSVTKSQERHKKVLEQHVTQVGDYTYDSKNKTLRSGETYIALGKYEHLYLSELLKYRGTPVSASHLMLCIWGEDEKRAMSLRELTSRLRKKLPALKIENITNIGYIIS
jgi:DNA-binding response OmpR family regulator